MARAGGAARSLNQLRGVHRPGEKVVIIIIICTRASFIAIRGAALHGLYPVVASQVWHPIPCRERRAAHACVE